MRPFLAEGCAPCWRTTDPRPTSSSFSRSASFGSNAERQRSSLKIEKHTFFANLYGHLKSVDKKSAANICKYCNGLAKIIHYTKFSSPLAEQVQRPVWQPGTKCWWGTPAWTTPAGSGEGYLQWSPLDVVWRTPKPSLYYPPKVQSAEEEGNVRML